MPLLRLFVPVAIVASLAVLPGCNGKDEGSDGGATDGGGDGGGTGVSGDNDGDGWSVEAGDCDDTNREVYPTRAEDCDGIDNNCNDIADEGFADTDGNGTADCVDTERCDGLDNDGDGLIDEGFSDSDGDGRADCLADEICDGLDNDGDGQVDEGFDADGDGYTTCGSSTTPADCDDSDPAVYPGASEVSGDLADNDCDGLVDESSWRAGDLLITEIMNNPLNVSDPKGEWFELVNRTTRSLVLNGLVITSTSGDDWHQITSDELITVAAGGTVVLGINKDMATNGGAWVDYQYNGVSLQNESDDLIVMAGDTIIDKVTWDDGATMPDPQGASMLLDPDKYSATLNDRGSSWCTASLHWDDLSDAGSPGSMNEYCWPIAIADYDPASTLYTCDTIQLYGHDSYDQEDEELSFDWVLATVPATSRKSTTDIVTPTSIDPTFTPDRAGLHSFELTVFNGTEYSETAVLDLMVLERPYNTAPTSDAGRDQSNTGFITCTPVSYGAYYDCAACPDAEFNIDGSASFDADGDSIVSYSWEITGGTGTASIDDANSASTTVTIGGPTPTYGGSEGVWVELTLTVEDCMGATGTDTILLSYTCTGR